MINKNTMRTERSVVRGSGSTTHIINNITPEINNSVTGINNTVSQINNSMNTMTGINTLSMGRTCKRVSGERETKELIMEVLI